MKQSMSGCAGGACGTGFAQQPMRKAARGFSFGGWLSIAVCLFGIVPVLAQQWQPLPLVTQAQRSAGNTGGEGCQVPNGLTIDSTGSFLLMGTDVGGIYRSLDGGTNWEPCNVGFKPRGGTGPAIDPNNSSRCLFAGGNSSSWPWHGLYLSTNHGDSWQSVLPLTYAGQGDEREQIAYDASSVVNGMSARVYYSALSGGLYKSVNGGLAWTKIQTSFGSDVVKVHPVLGYIYIADPTGFFRSTNGGTTFIQITNGLSPGAIQGLDVIASAPSNVYLVQTNGVCVSTDSGLTFARRQNNGLPLNYSPGPGRIKVSPANANAMVLNLDTGTWYNQPRYYSADGGDTWSSATFNSSQSFVPFNGRRGMFAWHPTQINVCFSFGGDWLTKSTDGGRTWVWNNQGYNGLCESGILNFNATNGDLLLCTSQDYNSALTADGGYTWKYLNVSGNGWGGYNYGGYAFNPTRMFAGNASSWSGPRNLAVSVNGGSSWTIFTNTAPTPTSASCGDPRNPNVGFWNNWRTVDQGATWADMPGCQRGVFTYNPSGTQELYGANGSTAVKSLDDGVTWTSVATFSGTINDIGFDQARNRLYVQAGGNRQLFMWQAGVITEITGRLPADNNGSRGANTVAVDPVNPDIVYAGVHADIYCSSCAVARSTDAGATWKILTKQPGDKGPDGGREANCIRVNPVTRYLYVGGSCYGIWKIAPPSPALSITPGTNAVIVLWQTNMGAGFRLEQTADLVRGPWSAVTNTPGATNSNFSVSIPVDSDAVYLRLSL